MRSSSPILFFALALLVISTAFSQSAAGNSLIENGSFDTSEDPFKGWVTDYAWAGNSHYMNNKNAISHVASEGSESSVLKIMPAGEGGAKVETMPILFEPGHRYECDFKIKGGRFRVYFAGYQWKPGVRPHENPELGELRMVYRSKVFQSSGSDWTSGMIELPGVELSATAIKNLKTVRFITVFFFSMDHENPGFVNDVSVRKIPDESLNF